MATKRSKKENKKPQVVADVSTVTVSSSRLPGQFVTQLSFEGARHMVSNRLPSARSERIVGMRIPDMTNETTSCVKNLKWTLKRVDISGLHLDKLPKDVVAELLCLERLDISSNDLTELVFPEECVNLKNLYELHAYKNRLTSISLDNSKRLTGLRRLNLTDNLISVWDPIDKLKNIQLLVLDDNQFPTMTNEFYENLKKLEVFHCARNLVKDIPAQIRTLKYLRDLDLSGNQLTGIPAELLLLPRIESLNLSGNLISRVPTVRLRGGLIRRQLAYVDLSDNALVKFPEQLFTMTARLDVSRNGIRALPIALEKRIVESDDKDLQLIDNPLKNPPYDVCKCGLRAILRFFQDAKVRMQTYQGLKVLVLGATGQGKTSLIQTLVDQQPRLTVDERTVLLDSFEYDIEMETERSEKETGEDIEDAEILASYSKKLQLSIWDFSGNIKYLAPLCRFLDNSSLVVIVFSMLDYKEDEFNRLIGTWMDWVIAKNNRLILLPVATHSDAVPTEQAAEIRKQVTSRISQHKEDHIRSIDEEIRKIESQPHIVPALSEHLKHCLNLKRLETFVHPEVISVSSLNNEGIEELVSAIKSLATNQAVFPQVLRLIPALWDQVERFAEERGNSLDPPYLMWKEYEDQTTEKFGMKRLLPLITRYLHDTGKVIWFSEHETLTKIIILRPAWLLEAMRSLLRHDAIADGQNIAEVEGYHFKQLGLTAGKFERLKTELSKKGIADKDFLRQVWFQLINSTDINSQFLDLASVVVQGFQLGYPLPKSFLRDGNSTLEIIQRSRNSTPSPSVTSDSSKTRTDSDTSKAKIEPCRVVPGSFVISCLRRTEQPVQLDEELERLADKPCVTAVFQFPRYTPPGLLDGLVIVIQSSKHALTLLYHWNSGLYAYQRVKRLNLCVRSTGGRDGLPSSVQLQLVDDSESVETTCGEELWKLMLAILTDVDTVLARQPGVYVERRMVCPLCKCPAFVGEWQTPKHLQSVPSVVCPSCHQDVETSFLIQPKEKRVVDEFLQKMAERQRNTVTKSAGTDRSFSVNRVTATQE